MKQGMQSISNETNVKTSLFEKISYGMGDVACNVVCALTSGLVVYFYTNVMSVSAVMIGMIMLFSRILDGVSDLAIGLIMDKVHSKHGRGRAWVLWMIIPYAVTAVALFCLPPNATEVVQGIYIFVTYNLCITVVYTALNLPYGAMAPLMTRNEDDLAKINLFRMTMSPIGNMIVSALTLPLINHMGGDQAAWIKVTFIYSVVAMGLLLWCFFGTKERIHTQAAEEAEKLPIMLRIKTLLKNKYFIIILLAGVFISIYQTVNGTCATYYAQYILGNNEYYGILNMAENIPQILVIMVLAPFIKKFGKRNIVLAGSFLVIAAQLSLLILPANLTVATVVAVLRGIGKGPIFGCIFTMMADVINFGHWKSGIRIQALAFSATTVGQKIGGGVASAVVGWLMESSGFTGQEVEIASAVSMIENLYIWGAVIAWAAMAVAMLLYQLDKQYDSMIEDMEKQGMFQQSAH